MSDSQKSKRRGLVTGVANKYSIAWGIASALSEEGYELCLTYPDDRIGEKVKELAADLPDTFTHRLNVASDDDFRSLGEAVAARWPDGLDGVVHSIAFANREDLGGLFAATSRAGFHTALDISTFSFIALTHCVLPLLEMRKGSVITLSYLGGQRVVPNYNVMGVAKAALEMSAKYLAVELGPKGVRVNVLSPGPIKTLAAKGITGFGEMLRLFIERSPLRRPISIEEAGAVGAFLLSDKSSAITGQVIFADGGHEIIGY